MHSINYIPIKRAGIKVTQNQSPTTEDVFISFPVFCLQDNACNKYEHEAHTNALGGLITCIMLIPGAWIFITVMGPNHAETVKQELSTETLASVAQLFPI